MPLKAPEAVSFKMNFDVCEYALLFAVSLMTLTGPDMFTFR